MTLEKYELSPEALRAVCDPKRFRFRTTAELTPLDGVIGQERAVQAIEFGLEMKASGYNMYVTGLEGTGKKTIVHKIAQDYAKKLPAPMDWCLVNNFQDEYCPHALALPTGKANAFSRRMHRIINELSKGIPEAFNEESFLQRKADIQKKHDRRRSRLLSRVDAAAAEKGLHVARTEAGLETVVLMDGKPMSREQFNALDPGRQRQIEENIRQIEHELEKVARKINQIGVSLHEAVEKLVDKETRSLVHSRLQTLREEFRGFPAVLSYLDSVEQDVVDNVQDFMPDSQEEMETGKGKGRPESSPLKKYAVNVLVDRGNGRGAPVIFEANPTYTNLFGQIEKRAFMGSVTTDFTMVQAGSLLKANGGILIMEVEPALANNFVWEALKRALQNSRLAIEDMTAELGFVSASLRPEPIPLEVKVILIGPTWPFQLLQESDSNFNKIFKVRADFDYEVACTEETQQQYAAYIARVCRQEKLLPFTTRGVSAIVEFGKKQVADTRKLSLRFGPIMGLIQEAEHWARKRKGRAVTDRDVVRAFKAHRFRYNLYEEKMQESFVDETILIDVEGGRIGQVNALAVYQVGDFSFGCPTRITAETFMGKKGVVNIEREVRLSGSTHDKGVLILSGFLGRTFARRYPLSLSISLTFEQSYSEIDGDSASSTELYAIISSLTEAPIRQGIAVTGSVDQKGQVQAIGGVNQKIEGFFEVCKARGLTGRQGVLIPKANEKNLMLRREVVDAVRKGMFHIYRVQSIDEGLEILTGQTAGKPGTDGKYPPGTLYGRAQAKLEDYARRSYELRATGGKNRP
ncbi:MAG: AAA family ATPase [Desulfobacterales bacterium]|jgi:lon-related putative ATP-dependent protease